MKGKEYEMFCAQGAEKTLHEVKHSGCQENSPFLVLSTNFVSSILTRSTHAERYITILPFGTHQIDFHECLN